MDIKSVTSWDSMPPVVYDGDIAFNTRPLEYNYRRMLDILRHLQAHYSGSLDHRPYYVKEAFEFLAKLDGLEQPR